MALTRKPAPEGSKCEEASTASKAYYIPCGKPATWVIQHPGEAPYNMCDLCATHNVKNRGAHYVEIQS